MVPGEDMQPVSVREALTYEPDDSLGLQPAGEVVLDRRSDDLHEVVDTRSGDGLQA